MVLKSGAPSFVVVGGAGAIGRIVVRDLFESNRKNRILVADFNGTAAAATSKAFRSSRVTSCAVDAGNIPDLAKVLRGHSVVINCTRHHFNLRVMRAALLAHVHYVDLGGLFLWTRRQLRFSGFKKTGITAVLGMGCAPGLTNVMAAEAADGLRSVDSVRIRVGSIDFNASSSEFAFPYSARTIVEELTLPPWRWSGGCFIQTAPRVGWERVDFGPPIGKIWVVMTRHSEIATLPKYFRRRGVQDVDFKVGFDKAFVRELMERMRAGQTIRDFEAMSAPRVEPNDYEITRVTVRGEKRTITLDCHAQARPEWHASAGDIDTACPASIVAQMLAEGVIDTPGVFAPEHIVPRKLLFDELPKRGMEIRRLVR